MNQDSFVNLIYLKAMNLVHFFHILDLLVLIRLLQLHPHLFFKLILYLQVQKIDDESLIHLTFFFILFKIFCLFISEIQEFKENSEK